ncbi:TadE family type IV pilus minor pilin [Actinopolymorpha sp. NPDC004070]|uniref:TadE family type IV pilus minor pilin n=1 Tax=Actinopolymorpha sp. NPDC004070 TaxID=3154548 RepID=UPI0033A7A678
MSRVRGAEAGGVGGVGVEAFVVPERRQRRRGEGVVKVQARLRGQAGMVTAETAVALTALVAVTLGMTWVVAVVGIQARCVDAARNTARAVARGESIAAGQEEGRRSAPEGARITVRRGGGIASVEVAADARPSWPMLSRLPAITVGGHAVVALEPGVS